MKWRKIWLVFAVTVFAAILIWWHRSRLTATVISVGTITLPKLIDQHWVSKQGKGEALFLVTEDGKGWKVKIQNRKLICQSTQITNAIGVSLGLFDMDEDGYPEFFKLGYDWAKGFGYSLWIFKRKESIKGRKVKRLPFPSWFPLSERSNWVLWARIPMLGGHAAYLILITEQKPKHPRKVVIFNTAGSQGGLFFLLSPDGQRLIPFDSGIWQAQDYWIGVESLKTLTMMEFLKLSLLDEAMTEFHQGTSAFTNGTDKTIGCGGLQSLKANMSSGQNFLTLTRMGLRKSSLSYT